VVAFGTSSLSFFLVIVTTATVVAITIASKMSATRQHRRRREKVEARLSLLGIPYSSSSLTSISISAG
jgi:hypothetical protein